jgi:hypothetical protein
MANLTICVPGMPPSNNLGSLLPPETAMGIALDNPHGPDSKKSFGSFLQKRTACLTA